MLKAVVFDLDGTLYQDLSFYKRYTAYIFQGSVWEARTAAIVDGVTAILEGNSAFRLGDFWKVDNADRPHDLSLLTVPRAENQAEIFEKLLPESLYLYAGDAWSMLRILAARAGISEEHRMRCFARVRQEMLTKQHAITTNPALFETLAALSRKTATYLFTNTAASDAETFVRHMGLFDKIGTIKYGRGKPFGFDHLIPEILRQTGADISEVLSVGDHSFNDLTPFLRRGAKTVLISPYPIFDTMPWDTRLSTLSELNEYLIKLI